MTDEPKPKRPFVYVHRDPEAIRRRARQAAHIRAWREARERAEADQSQTKNKPAPAVTRRGLNKN